MLRCIPTDHGLELVVILTNCVCGVLGEGLTWFDWRLFWVSVRTEVKLQDEDEGLFKRHGGLALSSSSLRPAGSPLMTRVDISYVGQEGRGFSHLQLHSV